MGVVMPWAGTVRALSMGTRANATATCTLRVNDVDSSDDVSLSASMAAYATASTTFAAGDVLCLFKEGTTTVDELIGTMFIEFNN